MKLSILIDHKLCLDCASEIVHLKINFVAESSEAFDKKENTKTRVAQGERLFVVPEIPFPL